MRTVAIAFLLCGIAAAQIVCPNSSQPMIVAQVLSTTGATKGTMQPVCMVMLGFTFNPTANVPTIIASPGSKGAPGAPGAPGAQGATGPQGPQGIQGPAGSATVSIPIYSSGTLIGNAAGIDITAGTGVICTPQIESSGNMGLQCNADAAYLATNQNLQSPTNPQICISSSANGSAYTASCTYTLQNAYATHQILYWFPDVTNAGSETISIDTFPAVPLLDPFGNPLALGILAPILYPIWFDGTNFRLATLLPAPQVSSLQRMQGNASGSNPCTVYSCSQPSNSLYTCPVALTQTQGACPYSNAGLELWNLELTDGTVIGPMVGIYDPSTLLSAFTSVPINQPVVPTAKR